MSIRIGDSATFSMAMITPESRVVETRRYLITPTEWEGIVGKCVIDKKYVTVTLCIGYGDNLEYMPTESQWRNLVEDTTNKLISHGANKNNCRIDIINEPEKYCTKEQQANYINLAHNQVRGRFDIGGGCSELNRRTRYQYISSHANFEVLVVHLQGACDTKAKTIDNLNFAQNLAISHNRILDCNEANYKDIATSKGFEHLKMLVSEAENYGCANIPIVFNNLDQSAFPGSTDRWKFLAFKVNGNLRSPYWNEWIDLMNSKAPVPNIIPIEEEDDDMKLVNLKEGSTGKQVRFLQEILMLEYGFPNEYEDPFDGKFGKFTDKQVRAYQEHVANNLEIDGCVGINTMTDLILNVDFKPVEDRKFSTNYWFKKLQIYMAFE